MSESYYPRHASMTEGDADAALSDEAQRMETERFLARLEALRAEDDLALLYEDEAS